MSTRTDGSSSTEQIDFDRACARLETALAGSMRREIAADACRASDLRQALIRVRESMRTHSWTGGTRRVPLDRIVRDYDRRTRQEGLHVLHDWDGKADHVNEDSIPVEVLNYTIEQRGGTAADPAVVAILLDYDFLYVLTLLSVRVWDSGEADDNLERLNGLLAALQGPDGSGQQFAADAETLLLIAGAHFEIEERGYDRLLERVRTLGAAARLRIAASHASSLGSHLRFGFEATYAKDAVSMRADNVADYPWLCYSLATLMDEYERLRAEGIEGLERERVVEAMLNGLTGDVDAFLARRPPACLATCETEWSRLRDRLQDHRHDLAQAWHALRPVDQTYSPLSFFFNFSHNVLKGTVIDAVLSGEAWTLTLNDLLTGLPRDDPKAEAKKTLARTLMGYARARPDTIRGRLMPVIVYDPWAGRQAFSATLRAIEKA